MTKDAIVANDEAANTLFSKEALAAIEGALDARTVDEAMFDVEV